MRKNKILITIWAETSIVKSPYGQKMQKKAFNNCIGKCTNQENTTHPIRMANLKITSTDKDVEQQTQILTAGV